MYIEIWRKRAENYRLWKKKKYSISFLHASWLLFSFLCRFFFILSSSFFLRHRHHHHCNFILSCLLMISIFCLQLLSIKHTKYYILLVVTFHQQNCISHIIIILHKRCLVILLLDTFPCNSFIFFNQWYKRNERIMLFVDKVWHFVQPY